MSSLPVRDCTLYGTLATLQLFILVFVVMHWMACALTLQTTLQSSLEQKLAKQKERAAIEKWEPI